MSNAQYMSWAKQHTVSLAVFLLVLLYALIVPLVMDAGTPSFSNALQPPSAKHIFGTDHFGFDLFVRSAESLRVSLMVGAFSALFATALGVMVGLIAATTGGRIDRIIMRINDAVNSIPHLILSVVIVALFLGSLLAIVISIALTHWSPVARIVRSSVLAVRTSGYVEASYAAGATSGWVLRKHLAPAALGQAVVAMVMLMPHAVWHESALSFLGLGIQADEPSLGTLMDLAREDIIRGAWWALLFPATVLLATTLSGVSLARKRLARATTAPEPARVAPTVSDTIALTGMNISVDSAHLVQEASLTLVQGKVTGLIGASGSGKTTLGRSIVGIAPEGASISGHVELNGQRHDWDAATLGALRGNVVGFVPQSAAQSFTPVRRIGAQIQEVIDQHHSPATVAELLRRVHLNADVADMFPHQLSGGMAQRAAIAAALAGNPRFIIADEPTSALDPELTRDILTLLRSLADELGVGVLIISHDIEDLRELRLCDSIAVMNDGEIVATGNHDDVLIHPQHPFCIALLAALPSGGLHLEKEAEHATR